jgi:hypothetical protein
MPMINSIHSRTESQVPKEVHALFGEPPVWRGESVSDYNKIMIHFSKLIKPRDIIEAWWIKDLTDNTWEIRRLRRLKVLLVEVRRDAWHDNLEMHAAALGHGAEDDPLVPIPDSEMDSAKIFMNLIDAYKKVDALIASTEKRRNQTLREIGRHREQLARHLRKASDEIIDGDSQLPQAA